MLKAVRRMSCKGQDTASQTAVQDMDIDDAQPAEVSKNQQMSFCEAGLLGFAKVLSTFGLRDQPETVREIAETLSEVVCSPDVPGNDRGLLGLPLF